MELETLVRNFRKAIEDAQTNYEPGSFFRKFPTRQCGHTSDMLAQYLIDNGIGPITYVSGTYYDDCPVRLHFVIPHITVYCRSIQVDTQDPQSLFPGVPHHLPLIIADCYQEIRVIHQISVLLDITFWAGSISGSQLFRAVFQQIIQSPLAPNIPLCAMAKERQHNNQLYILIARLRLHL